MVQKLSDSLMVWIDYYLEVAVQGVRSEEVAGFEHINIHGKYSFDISVPLSNGGLRPLVGMS